MTDASEDEWGPWIEHVQGPCPVNSAFIVLAEMGHAGSGDFVGPMPAFEYDWDFPDDPIARYRIRKFRGMKVLQELLQDLPETVPDCEGTI